MSSASSSFGRAAPARTTQLDSHVEQFPLVTPSRPRTTSCTASCSARSSASAARRASSGGSAPIRRGRQARAALKGLVGELYRRAAISFPDEDVLVAGRIAHPPAYSLLARSPTCARARSTRRPARSGPGAGGSPAASAATPATTTARSGSRRTARSEPVLDAERGEGAAARPRPRSSAPSTPTKGEAVIAFGWAIAEALRRRPRAAKTRR